MALDISPDEYKRLIHAGQQYVAQKQAADPEWQAWQQAVSSLPFDAERPASPTKDYWSEYTNSLGPEMSQAFQNHMANSNSWQNNVGKVLKVAIPAAVGGVGLAGTGLLGTAAQSAVGAGAASAPALTGVDAAMADLAASGGLTPASMGASSGVWGGLSGIPGAASSTGLLTGSELGTGASGAGLLSKIGGTAGDVANWLGNNRGLVSLLGGALAAAGSASNQNSGGNSSKTYAPQPGLRMGTLQQSPMNQSAGTLAPMQNLGLQNSGLARFGATGGLFTPNVYKPQTYRWGQ